MYETTISFTYDAESPLDAAQQLIANIQANPYWYVKVKHLPTGDTFTVDTQSGEVEEN